MLIGNHLFLNCLKCEFALRNIAKNGKHDTNEGIGNSRVKVRQTKCESLDQNIVQHDKGSSDQCISEELYTPMQIRLRENNMTG